MNGTWVWKQVTLNDKTQLGEHDVDAIFSTRLQPARVFKWFPGKAVVALWVKLQQCHLLKIHFYT